MIRTIDPGRKKEFVNLIDNVTYSTVTDLEGKPLELKMSITAPMGPAEMALQRGQEAPEELKRKRPCIVWFNGDGWRGSEKNSNLANNVYLAENGYVFVCAYYRGSHQGKLPAQITDAKTAVRFIRANAEKYGVDPDRIAVSGRSAGGHLASFVGMNDGKYISAEYPGVSSDVSAVIDFYGPAEFYTMTKEHVEMVEAGTLFENTGRWHTMADTHEGAALGGDMDTLLERSREFTPIMNIVPTKARFLILQGTEDPLVDYNHNIHYHDRLNEAGVQADLYLVKGAGHGTPEFIQPETKEIILGWLKENL